MTLEREETRSPEGEEDVEDDVLRAGPIQRNHLVRFPDPGSDLERPLAEANRRARERSLRWVQEAVPALDWAALAQTTDAATLVVGEVGDGFVESLEVDELLQTVTSYIDPVTHTTVKLPDQEGGQMPFPGHTLIPSPHPLLISRLAHGPVAHLLGSGQTLILNQVEQYAQPIMDAVDHMGRVLGNQVNINCYVSYGGAEGFGAHWDDHDVLIVQVRGRKYWEVYQPTALSAMRPNVPDDTSDQLVWSGILEPGSSLMIPRGWGHRVESFDELSVHLTIGLNRFNLVGLVELMAAEASNHPLFRADLPYDPSQPAHSYAGSVFDTPASFDEHFAPIVDAVVGRGLARMRAAVPMTPISSFTDVLAVTVEDAWEEGVYAARYAGGLMVVQRAEPDELGVAAAQRVIDMPLEYLPVLAECAAGEDLTFDELVARSQGGRDVVRAAVRALVGAGVVNVVGRTGGSR